MNVDDDTLLYYIADSLQMTLHLLEGRYRASEKRKLYLGPWVFEEQVTACSDIVSKTVCSFVVKVTSRVFLYLVSRDSHTTAYVFDGQDFGLTAASLSKFGEPKLEDTLIKLMPKVRGTFKFTASEHKWVPANAADLGKTVKV